MKPETYNALTDSERQELRNIGTNWPEWAKANIGVNGDPWEGLKLAEEGGERVILYQLRPTPFRTNSRNVAAALIEDAQMNLSRL